MSKKLIFKILTPGFSLRRAITEFGDFRVWETDDGDWRWAFNKGHNVIDGAEETLDEAMTACQRYYDEFVLDR